MRHVVDGPVAMGWNGTAVAQTGPLFWWTPNSTDPTPRPMQGDQEEEN